MIIMCIGIIFTQLFLCRRTRLTGPRLGLNSEPAAHCARHALLHMAPKWSSHWTTQAGQRTRISGTHFYMTDGFPVIQPTVSKHWRKVMYYIQLAKSDPAMSLTITYDNTRTIHITSQVLPITNWLGFTSQLTQNRSFRRRSPSLGLVWKNKI